LKYCIDNFCLVEYFSIERENTLQANVTGRQRLVRRYVAALRDRGVDIVCEVPGCSAEAEFDAPGYWCERHWRVWWQSPEEDSEPEWMSDPASRASGGGTARPPPKYRM